ncbi:MAG: hypothetical protein R2710_07205 [Acidimicrobiales bacterium]
MAKELAEARAQILEADPTAIIANHAFGMYELAMLHITNDDPDMKAARLAVDALGALVEGLRGRLDEAESPLNERCMASGSCSSSAPRPSRRRQKRPRPRVMQTAMQAKRTRTTEPAT